ncbi:hypothetical protein [Thiocapsa roseopersicina]|uniref:hypothetical protein n=1 Tax=Thiocapsa roseopersicina TaxID=1058 RepID=UPI00158794C6|nr:hypothetical protein [Thiocapsa roseopersicina]
MSLASMARVALAIPTALIGVGCGSGYARPGQRSAVLGDGDPHGNADLDLRGRGLSP